MRGISLKEIYIKHKELGGEKINISGFIKNLRNSKTFGFIELNDGSYFKNIQVVFDRRSEAIYVVANAPELPP